MSHECFENDEIADIMNKYFINVKVDREEMPTVDKMCENFLIALKEVLRTFQQDKLLNILIIITKKETGWPITVFLTPDLKPFYGGTYFAPYERYGKLGFPTLCMQLGQRWKSDRRRIMNSTIKIMYDIKEQSLVSNHTHTLLSFNSNYNVYNKLVEISSRS